MAPTILRQGSFRLFFFSREESRIHVHVAHPDGEAKFWLTPAIAVATSVGLSERQLREAGAIVEAHLEEIVLIRAVMPGIDTLVAEVTHVSRNGLWLLVDDEELLLNFEQFPWFRKGSIEQVSHVERPTRDHLCWPELDIDLSIASIREPELFPLVSRADG